MYLCLMYQDFQEDIFAGLRDSIPENVYFRGDGFGDIRWIELFAKGPGFS